jgi:hypothetical protein
MTHGLEGKQEEEEAADGVRPRARKKMQKK